jgi:excisionase family DNA binding protein
MLKYIASWRTAVRRPPPLSLLEAAHHLGLSYGHAWRLVRSGQLPATQVAGRHLVDRDDLARVLELRKSAKEAVR